jgi:TonB-linked SusC/RagA family outer membrane protein
MRLWGKFLPLAAAAALWVAADATPVAAQAGGTVTGNVVDATSGRTLESAQVFIPALNQGALTNQAGRFIILNVPAGTHELRVELIGYTSASQEVTVTAGQTQTVEFRLESTALRLQELVVTGVAGSTPRIKLPFTVESVDFENMPVPSPSADGLIQGKVPGVRVVRGSGQPGDDSDIMLRGPTTITGTQQPLIIIDGVITDNSMSDIASLDVSSIEVVKGAAAASLYGSRAQNGVVQITTKRGQGLSVDQSRITVRNEYGVNQLEGSVPLVRNHPYQMDESGNFLALVDGNLVPVDIRYFVDKGTGEVCDPAQDPTQTVCAPPPNPLLNNRLNPGEVGTVYNSFQDSEYPYPLYDHVDQFFNPGRFYSGYVAAEGRTGSTNYRASFTHQAEGGVVDELDGFKLNGFRLNLDHQIRDDLTMAVSTYYSRSRSDDSGTGPFYDLTFQAPFADLTARQPNSANQGPCGAEGCYVWRPDPFSQETNPLYQISLLDNQDTRQRFLGAANITWSPLTWFELEGNFSLDQSNFYQTDFEPAGMVSDQSGFGQGGLDKDQRHDNDMNASFTASFNKSFGDLTTRTKVRYLLEDQHREQFDVNAQNFFARGVPDLDNIGGSINIGSSIQDVLAEGYFFISALDYQGKYVGDFLVRRDGSSLFGPDERWQTYYRASGAWRLAQEAWWPFDDLNEFKLRYSIGTAGGRPRFAAQYETYDVGSDGIQPETLGNRALKPELSTEQEVGLETVFFNKINAGVTYAWSRVEDQLLEVPLAGYRGFANQWQNAGTIESKTLEAFVEMALIDSPRLGWTTRVNFDRTRQDISELNIAPYREGFFYVREGEELGTFYGSKWIGSCGELPSGTDCSEFAVNDDGLLVWVGAGNGFQDGISKGLWGSRGEINGATYDWGVPIAGSNEVDGSFLFMGNTTPDFNLTWSNTFRMGSLSLYTLIDGEIGADVYNQTRQWAYRDRRSGNQDQAGKPDGLKKPIVYYQRLYNTNASSSWFVEDGSFVKLREASLRYTLDQSLVDRAFGTLGVDGLAVNLIGRNLLTFTDYDGYDPETGVVTNQIEQAGGSSAIGRVDNFGFPNFRTLSASLEIIF